MRKEKDKLTDSDLYGLLKLALLENKFQFVNMLLEHDINLEGILNIGKLKELYDFEAVSLFKVFFNL